MLELSALRKNKIHLSDYPYVADIDCRILMSDFSSFDIEILEEILFSPLKISLKKMAKALCASEEKLLLHLKKFEGVGLLTVIDDAILVDKEKRKHFEFEITRFDPQFKPDMEFLQGLLRKVPIHVLPTWYATPRSSNNIFESVQEKYLFTPHIFQRFYQELNLGDPTFNAIIHDVYHSKEFKVSSSDIISKYNLSAKAFEEMILLLEFHFVCCLVFEKEGDHWLEYVTPFQEWKEYLCFYMATEALCIDEPIERCGDTDFSFIEEMSNTLLKAKKGIAIPPSAALDKLCLLKLAENVDGKVRLLEAGEAWLDLSLENRALHLYRHPHNRMMSLPTVGERHIREAEKSIKRVLHGGWVYFDDFFKGVLVPLNEHSVVVLKRFGKQWKYALPSYSEEEKTLIKTTIFEWLYEFGMVMIGKSHGRDCFAVTPFGRFFFED